MRVKQEDITLLEALYAGRKPYHGEMHDHSNSGGKSDGKELFTTWKYEIMPEKGMDFAVIVDHKQSLHMRLSEWDNSMFIGGTEAGTTILGRGGLQSGMHYNMIFADPDKQDQLVSEFSEYRFSGGDKGIFVYPRFEPVRFRKVVKRVRELGGFFVNVHPKYKSYLQSDDPMDYLYGEYTGIEIMTGHGGDMTRQENMDAYNMWVALLNRGKIVFATAGSDSHRRGHTHSLTTVYSTKKDAHTFLEYFRKGDFTAGPIGIRMAMGDVTTGGETAFTGKRLVVAAGDFHCQEHFSENQYRLDLYNETGLVAGWEFDNSRTAYFALDAEPCRYYRANIYDVTRERIVAVGNPIWNQEF